MLTKAIPPISAFWLIFSFSRNLAQLIQICWAAMHSPTCTAHYTDFTGLRHVCLLNDKSPRPDLTSPAMWFIIAIEIHIMGRGRYENNTNDLR
jgi:hypothetical protein